MKRRVIAVVSLSLSLGLGGMQSAALAQETKEDLTATNGDAAALGNGNASSAPGTVTRNGVSGVSLLGPDGTYRVTENSPPIVMASAMTTRSTSMPRTPVSGTRMGMACPMATSS